MTTTDTAAIEHESALADMRRSFETVWAIIHSDHIDDDLRAQARAALEQAWQNNAALNLLINQSEAVLREVGPLIDAAIAAANEMAAQRDTIADEHARLIKRLPALYEEALLTVIESLTNDIAAALAITPDEASLLYALLNDPEPDVLAADNDLDPDQVESFRSSLLALFDALTATQHEETE